MHRDEVRVPNLCDIEWRSLEKRSNARFCGRCQTLVADLSSLSEKKARALLANTEQRLCVRYLYDATGRIHFADSAPLVPASRLRLARNAASVAALAAPLLFQACGEAADDGWSPVPEQAGATSAEPAEQPVDAGAADAGTADAALADSATAD